MPEISRVNQQNGPPKRPPSTRSGVLGRIKALEDRKIGLRCSVYGQPKTGKTRFACSFPKPLLLIGTEDGTTSVIGVKGVDFVMLESCSELAEILRDQERAQKYKTLVLDNGTRFRDMRITEILGLKELPLQKGWGFAAREQWGECALSIKEMWTPMFHLARRTALNVVMIAQEQTYSGKSDEEAPSDPSSEIIAPHVGSALGKSLCDWINAECDYVCQTLIRAEEKEVSGEVAGQTVVEKIKTGKKEYCLRIGPSEVYYTGFRLPNGRALREDFIINPTYEKMAAIISGTPPKPAVKPSK